MTRASRRPPPAGGGAPGLSPTPRAKSTDTGAGPRARPPSPTAAKRQYGNGVYSDPSDGAPGRKFGFPWRSADWAPGSANSRLREVWKVLEFLGISRLNQAFSMGYAHPQAKNIFTRPCSRQIRFALGQNRPFAAAGAASDPRIEPILAIFPALRKQMLISPEKPREDGGADNARQSYACRHGRPRTVIRL